MSERQAVESDGTPRMDARPVELLQRRERERREAPLWQRIQWFVFGRNG